MSANHTLHLDITTRQGSQTPRSLVDRPVNYNIRDVEEDQVGRHRLRASQGERQIINNGVRDARYVAVVARYLVQDDALPEPVAPGDFAPFSYRLNGETLAQSCDGFFAHAGTVTDLRVTTPYDTNEIELLVIFG
ncbi:MAG: hypothetical protein RIF32_19295 [Leptospirales bacterium]|jgi:hypothetical protein